MSSRVATASALMLPLGLGDGGASGGADNVLPAARRQLFQCCQQFRGSGYQAGVGLCIGAEHRNFCHRISVVVIDFTCNIHVPAYKCVPHGPRRVALTR